MIRLFAALPIPAATATFLQRLQDGIPGARWSAAEKLHITLRFAGEISERLADALDAEMTTIAGPPLTVRLAGAGAFDHSRSSRAVWIGVEADQSMRVLQRRCEAAARRAGLPPEKRRWRPHVTLAYLPVDVEPARVGQWIQHHNLARAAPFIARGFALYSSRLSKDGAEYRLERTYPLTPGPHGPSERPA